MPSLQDLQVAVEGSKYSRAPQATHTVFCTLGCVPPLHWTQAVPLVETLPPWQGTQPTRVVGGACPGLHLVHVGDSMVLCLPVAQVMHMVLFVLTSSPGLHDEHCAPSKYSFASQGMHEVFRALGRMPPVHAMQPVPLGEILRPAHGEHRASVLSNFLPGAQSTHVVFRALGCMPSVHAMQPVPLGEILRPTHGEHRVSVLSNCLPGAQLTHLPSVQSLVTSHGSQRVPLAEACVRDLHLLHDTPLENSYSGQGKQPPTSPLHRL